MRSSPLRPAFVLLVAACGCGGTEAPQAGAGGAASAQQAPADPAASEFTLPFKAVGPLRFEPGGVSLGTVAPGSVHSGTIAVRNTSPEPVEILAVKSTCLCTVAEDPGGQVLPPGASVELPYGFNAPREPGHKTAKLTVVFRHLGLGGYVDIAMEAQIAMVIRAEPAFVDALRGVTSGSVRVASVDGQPFRILSSGGARPAYGDGFDPAADSPRSEYSLAWNVRYPSATDPDCGSQRLWWIIETDHPQCPILPLRIRHECTGSRSDPNRRERGWFFKDAIVNLETVRAGETVDTDVDVRLYEGAAGITIDGVHSLSPDAEARLVSASPGANDLIACRVSVTPKRGYSGLLYAMVRFTSPTGHADVAFVAQVKLKAES